MSVKRTLFLISAVAAILVFAALGVWQVQRLDWKTGLIERVNARVIAAPVAAPDRAEWPEISREADEYRRVTLTGRFLHEAEAQVYALTEKGAGYWVMTPLQTADGIVYVNRGYVPSDKRRPDTRPDGQTPGAVTVTGLIRIPEARGWLFSQKNDPAAGRWYLRDVVAMGEARGLAEVAPYFIDADATPNAGGWPLGGLTRIVFPNSHLTYALTWFSMALGLAGVLVWLNLPAGLKSRSRPRA